MANRGSEPGSPQVVSAAGAIASRAPSAGESGMVHSENGVGARGRRPAFARLWTSVVVRSIVGTAEHDRQSIWNPQQCKRELPLVPRNSLALN